MTAYRITGLPKYAREVVRMLNDDPRNFFLYDDEEKIIVCVRCRTNPKTAITTYISRLSVTELVTR